MNRSTSILVFPVIHEYSIMVVLSALFAWLAYAKMSDSSNRKMLISLSLIDIIIGLLVGQVFPDPDRISDIGISILIPSFIMNLFFIWKIYQSEEDLDVDD